MLCYCCPFECGVNRNYHLGVCGAPEQLKIAKVMAHFWEEPCISGKQGSGTIFFSHCNASCIYCQNYKISQKDKGQIYTKKQMIELCQNMTDKYRIHNINLVSPTHYSHQLIEVLPQVKKCLKLPIIWNSNAYEKSETIKKVHDSIDIFLPDLKYFDASIAKRFSNLPDYFKYASKAITMMRHLAGEPIFNHNGLMQKGLLIRHLVLPGQIEDSKKIISWIAENLGNDTYVSLMSQYYPAHKAVKSSPLNRSLSCAEYTEIKNYFFSLGFTKGFIQDIDSNSSKYTPDF